MAGEGKNKKSSERDEDIKVTVIIPTYNRSSFLKRAIESVLNQSHKNLEIIVVDDASTDNTREIVNSFNSSKIKYIRNKKRMGPNFSRNVGLKNASGDYIAFLDDDDYYCDKDKLKKQLKLFQKNDNLGFVGSAYQDKLVDIIRRPNLKGKIDKELLISFSDIETSTILIKREMIDKVGYLDESLPSEQNHDFFYRISKISEFDYLPEVTVIKEAPSQQISTNVKKKMKGYILFHKKHFQDIKKLGYRKCFFVIFKFLFTIILLVFVALFRKPFLLPKFYELVRKNLAK